VPRKIELTWQPGTGGRAGRWRKKHKGRVVYLPFGSSRSDIEGYRQALEAWKHRKAEIDAEEASKPKSHQAAYEETVKEWTLVLGWAVEHGDEEHARIARGKIDALNERLLLPKPSPIEFYDRVASLYAYPTEILEHIASQFRDQSQPAPDPSLSTTFVPTRAEIESIDGTPMRIRGEIWKDRVESQRSKIRSHTETIEVQVENFLAGKQLLVAAGKRSAGRYEALRCHLHHFRDWLGGRVSATSISGKVLSDYHAELLKMIADETYSTDYANDRMSAVKSLIRWMWRKEAIPELPRLLDSKNEDLRIGKKVSAIEGYEISEVKALLCAANDRTKLYLLLMLNTGMTQVDISDVLPSEVDWAIGTITRKRSKTQKHKNVPTVTFKLWKETLRLLTQERADGAATVLVNENGGPLKTEVLDSNRKVRKTDNIANAFKRLRARCKITKSLKQFRKTSASLVRSNKEFTGVESFFLSLSPKGISDRHYAKPPQAILDEAIGWLAAQYGVE
jgi:integrase